MIGSTGYLLLRQYLKVGGGKRRFMKKVKNLIIGLDGATFDLIYPWVQEGSLPTLGKLMEAGSYGNLETVFPPLTAPKPRYNR